MRRASTGRPAPSAAAPAGPRPSPLRISRAAEPSASSSSSSSGGGGGGGGSGRSSTRELDAEAPLVSDRLAREGDLASPRDLAPRGARCRRESPALRAPLPVRRPLGAAYALVADPPHVLTLALTLTLTLRPRRRPAACASAEIAAEIAAENAAEIAAEVAAEVAAGRWPTTTRDHPRSPAARAPAEARRRAQRGRASECPPPGRLSGPAPRSSRWECRWAAPSR